MGYLTYFANMNGDVHKLYAPIDGDNHLCGYGADNAVIDGEFRTYNKLFISNLKATSVQSIFESGVCVESCPTADGEAVKFRKTSHVADGVKGYATTEVVTYCFPHASSLPEDMVQGWKMAKDQFLNSSTGQYFNDLWLSSRAIYASIGMAPIYCFVFIAVMSAFAETISWIIIILVQIGLIGAAAGLWFLRDQWAEQYEH